MSEARIKNKKKVTTRRQTVARIPGASLAAPVLLGVATAQVPDRVGPQLETVKAFGDDFRLVGIGVSHRGQGLRYRAILECPLTLQHGRGRSQDRRGHALS